MTTTTSWGILCMGFVFGYLLYYAVKDTKAFNIELLSSAIGAVGGGAVIGLFGKTDGWIGPYGIGLLAGFLFYLILALILFALGKGTSPLAQHVIALSRTLLGSSWHE